jgi:1-phosphofructokinase/tagatose 6-phosphate kinase
MYLTVSMNPTLQKVLCFSSMAVHRVNRTRSQRLDVAGKGLNVCRVLSQLGKQVVHLTHLGGDMRTLFLEMIAREGLAIRWVESGGPDVRGAIRFCYTLVDERDGSVTELIEKAESVDPGTEDRLRKAYEELLPDCGVVVIAGTRAPGFSDDLVPFMVRRAKELERKVVLDLWGADLLGSLAFNPDVIKPNLMEFAATWAPSLIHNGVLIDDEAAVKEQVRDLCRILFRRYHCGIVLTRGVKAVWFAQGEDFFEYPFEPMSKPVNTTGSGDAFTAGLSAALGDGAGLREAVAEGVRCGYLNAGFLKVGTIAYDPGRVGQ